MPVYDRHCYNCGYTELDQFEPLNTDNYPCVECQTGSMERAILPGKANTVIGDDIPGGLKIRHGLCHEDGSARVFHSRTEIAAAARAAGLKWGGNDSTVKCKTDRWV